MCIPETARRPSKYINHHIILITTLQDYHYHFIVTLNKVHYVNFHENGTEKCLDTSVQDKFVLMFAKKWLEIHLFSLRNSSDQTGICTGQPQKYLENVAYLTIN